MVNGQSLVWESKKIKDTGFRITYGSEGGIKHQ